MHDIVVTIRRSLWNSWTRPGLGISCAILALGALVLALLWWQIDPVTRDQKREIYTLLAQVMGGVILFSSILVAWRGIRVQQDISGQRGLDDALQNYIVGVTDLLVNTHSEGADEDIRSLRYNIATARTLTILKGLDGARKGSVLRFLAVSKLITKTSAGEADPLIPLTSADYSDAQLGELPLRDCDLQAVNFMRATLAASDLTGAQLSQANLTHANLADATLNLADLTGGKLTHVSLIRAQCLGAVLLEADLTGADLSRADLSEANFGNANLTNVNFTGAILNGANFSGANLTNANFRRVDLGEVSLSQEQKARIRTR